MIKTKKLKQIHKGNYSEIDLNVYAPIALKILQNWNPLLSLDMEFYNAYPPEAWALACGNRGVYQLITNETLCFIQHLVKGSRAIEVCAGIGTIGRSLKIPTTDRMVNKIWEANLYYKAHDNFYNKPIEYPKDIEQITAHQAIKKYDPQWIIASWVTQKLIPGPKIGQMYGPMEEEFIDGRNYIHLGSGQNLVHQKKRINKKSHWVIEADWIVARDSHKSQSQIRIWAQDMDIDFDSFPEDLEFVYYLNN